LDYGKAMEPIPQIRRLPSPSELDSIIRFPAFPIPSGLLMQAARQSQASENKDIDQG